MKRSTLLVSALALTALLPPAMVSAQSSPQAAPSQAPAVALPPLFDAEMQRSIEFVSEMMEEGVVVPVPRDPGGGYTHEQHKRNFRAIYLSGQLYRVTGDKAYADYGRDMLLAYAKLYPTLGEHPAKANQNPGRLFWQVLNDAMWLVHSVQGYAEIRDTLSEADRKNIDDNVFRRMATFLSVDSQATFDLIHNHATWATAGVGMTGYLLGDQDLVDIALLGSDKSGKAGFIRQTELLFSPDGYYTEGPYYQRFALLPFLVFADTIERNEPERKIFEYRDGILLKALRTTIQLSYRGYFFPFNDAIRDKSLRTSELYDGVAIAYAKTRDPSLLSVADFQNRTVLTANGLMVAKDLAAGKAKPFPFRSLLLSDGPNGDEGAVAILREGPANAEGEPKTVLIAKNSSQGMGHGHFDKLAWQLYDNGHEIVRDYGAARFLNIEAKEGGRYLPENETWAKTTVAHNTLVVDETSHFGGNVRTAEGLWPDQLYYLGEPGLQVTSAVMDGAYPGVSFTRTMVMPVIPGLEQPIIVDLVNASSDDAHLYDLPLHYSGHILEFDFDVESMVTDRPVLGTDQGYQHIWVDALGRVDGDSRALTWINDDRFYTYRFAGDGPLDVVLGESGANDPNFNLRREPILMLRAQRDSGDASFVSILEAHGKHDGASEQTVASRSRIADMAHDRLDGMDIVRITLKSGKRYAVAISHNSDDAAAHSANVGGDEIEWTGFAAVVALPDRENG